MSCPFPGTDPWLESTAVWPGFHDTLTVKTVEVLQPDLRPRGYYVDLGERVWLAGPGRGIFPEDLILRGRRPPTSRAGEEQLLTVDEPVRIARLQVEVREPYVEIYDALRHEIITGLEFLSPTNKRNPKGRRLYRQKQAELRQSNVHLVEIDLLRRGPHVLDIPLDLVKALSGWHYLVNIVRRRSDEYQFYPITLRDRLPRIRIPLKVGDVDAVLDLQEVFNRSYEIGSYPERLDDSRPAPPPEFGPDDAAWADQTLRSKGLRQ